MDIYIKRISGKITVDNGTAIGRTSTATVVGSLKINNNR